MTTEPQMVCPLLFRRAHPAVMMHEAGVILHLPLGTLQAVCLNAGGYKKSRSCRFVLALTGAQKGTGMLRSHGRSLSPLKVQM